LLKAVAVPDITPKLLYTNPDGRGVDGLIAKLNGAVPVPPCTVTGVNGVYPTPCVNIGIAPETTATGVLGLTTMANCVELV
jgi:hypothetical protein